MAVKLVTYGSREMNYADMIIRRFTVNDVPLITLNDGNTIPQLGFGVYQIDASDTVESVSQALEIGYRHIDTAEMYQNEQQVGEAIAGSDIPREEIFITSKLNNGFHKPDDAKRAFDETLKKLGVEYIDLFLIHWPLPTLYDGDFVSTWQTLETFKADGRARSIGVSNFQIDHLKALADAGTSLPAVNQIEIHPYFTNAKLADYCQANDIHVEAWSPIAQGKVLDDSVINKIADEVDKTPAQVTLRWHIQHGYIVFPKSTTLSRIKENFDIFDFELSDEHMAAIDALEKGEAGRTGPDPDTFDYIPA